jgi:DNA invertase Pin-like site-specific DNA recombinase
MKHQIVGYIRVSSERQNTDRQLEGKELDKVFIEVMSGKSANNREKLREAIDYVREGDTFAVHSIDRLARNLRDLQEIIHELLKKGVSVFFVKENLFFTANHDPMATLMLQMMGAFAEFERSMIRSRQKEGIDMAKKNGRKLGRKTKINKEVEKEVHSLKDQGTSIRQIAFKMNLSRATVYKALSLST